VTVVDLALRRAEMKRDAESARSSKSTTALLSSRTDAELGAEERPVNSRDVPPAPERPLTADEVLAIRAEIWRVELAPELLAQRRAWERFQESRALEPKPSSTHSDDPVDAA